MRLPLSIAALLALATLPTCATTPEADAAYDDALPAWLMLQPNPNPTRDRALDEAAALLCERSGAEGAIVDDDIRMRAGVTDAALDVVVRRGENEDALRVLLAPAARAAQAAFNGSHVGFASTTAEPGTLPFAQRRGNEGVGKCGAVVLARRMVLVGAKLQSRLPAKGELLLPLAVPLQTIADLHVLGPDGFVDSHRFLPNREGRIDVMLEPFRGEGRYLVEVVLDGANDDNTPKNNPVVALLWPMVFGEDRLPPSPEVLFPDVGHSDHALSIRAETLFQRLRNEQLLMPFILSPLLAEEAQKRADDVAAHGLGHRLPTRDATVLDVLAARAKTEPLAFFSRAAEVQAVGATLSDAWNALIDSPAHRAVLTDPGLTHAGVVVVRGKDAVGRATVNVVALLGRRPAQGNPEQVASSFIETWNRQRKAAGFDPLLQNRALSDVAARLSRTVAESRDLSDKQLGAPAAELVMAEDARFSRVLPIVARVEDPGSIPVPQTALEIDTTHAAVAVTLDEEQGVWAIVILFGQ